VGHLVLWTSYTSVKEVWRWCTAGLVRTISTGEDPGFNAQECTNKALNTSPFGNTCEADEVSPEVEARVVAGLRCLQP
jgi:hypothetical protein